VLVIRESDGSPGMERKLTGPAAGANGSGGVSTGNAVSGAGGVSVMSNAVGVGC
jgi:hypothetical protein